MTDTDEKNLTSIIIQSLSLCKRLRYSMLSYCKCNNKNHRNDILMDFVRRIECNLFAVAILAKEAKSRNSGIYLKLPMGIILRNCYIDGIHAFYLKDLTDDEFEEEVRVLNLKYVKSFDYRKPLYADRLKEVGLNNPEIVDNCFPLTIEDNFWEFLSFEKGARSDGSWPYKEEKDIRQVYSEIKRTDNINKMYSCLKDNSEVSNLAERVYAYYKYFSQYEHFSEYSHGDSLAPFEEDNVSFGASVAVLVNVTDYIINGISDFKS